MIQIRHFLGMTLTVKIVPQDSFPFCEKLQDTQKLASRCCPGESRDLLQILSLVYDSKHVLLALALARQVRFTCVPCYCYEERSCWEAERLDLWLSVRCRREPARCHCTFWRCTLLPPRALCSTDMDRLPAMGLSHSSPESCTQTLWECLLSAAGCGLDRAWSSGFRPLL